MRSASALTLISLLGCSTPPEQTVTLLDYPELEVSNDAIEFGTLDLGGSARRSFVVRNNGELEMGLQTIALRDEAWTAHFNLTWSPESVDCPDGAAPAAEEPAAEDRAAVDTWDNGGDGGSGGDGGGADGADGADGGGGGGAVVDEDGIVRMGPGCELPVTIDYLPSATGEMWASVEVTTISQPVEKDDEGNPITEPEYFRDPDRHIQTVILHGAAVQGVGSVLVRSASIDMGHHYPGEDERRHVYVYNTGDGDLTVAPPVPAAGCDEAFSLDTSTMLTRPLLPGEATFFDVVFRPTDLDPAFCDVEITSDDPETPLSRVRARGNAGADPENVAPEVAIRSPAVGYQHRDSTDLILEVDMFDLNQPASTLVCKVRSLLAEARIADCSTDSDSGHVFVRVPVDLLEAGTDTLQVQVTDQSENISRASTTVLWKSLYPPSDDDGDGWGDDPSDGPYVDCDDERDDVYPGAAELADNIDNDCDGAIDEGSTGGDDDGDSVSEVNGDCDDTDASTYPGAMERADQKDNDCDGFVDEGTSLVDDDGDGYSELDLDCDDEDPDAYPGAPEYCDGKDSNCNFIQDDAEPTGCIERSTRPEIIGGIRMSHTAIGSGESATLQVFVTDGDGDDLTYAWAEDSTLQSLYQHVAISTPNATTVTFVAPVLPEDSPGDIFTLTVQVQDPAGNFDVATADITVYPEPIALEYEQLGQVDTASSCGSSDSSAAGLLFPAAGLLAFAARRRRRSD